LISPGAALAGLLVSITETDSETKTDAIDFWKADLVAGFIFIGLVRLKLDTLKHKKEIVQSKQTNAAFLLHMPAILISITAKCEVISIKLSLFPFLLAFSQQAGIHQHQNFYFYASLFVLMFPYVRGPPEPVLRHFFFHDFLFFVLFVDPGS
jgi:hypothetical protein